MNNFPFCGVFRCSCGAMMTAQWAKGHGGLYRYYRCTRKSGNCTEPYVQEKEVQRQCSEALLPLALTSEQAAEAYNVIDEQSAKDSQSLLTEIEGLDDKMTPIQKKLDRLTHTYLD